MIHLQSIYFTVCLSFTAFVFLFLASMQLIYGNEEKNRDNFMVDS